MGAGKTTVGQELGQKLGWEFTDLDDIVVDSAGKSIPEIFASEGEAGFRQREFQALTSVLSQTDRDTVVALGGGAFVQEEIFKAILNSGCPSIHLHAEFETLFDRCSADAKVRPLLKDENHFRQLYEARRSGYMRADYLIDTTGKSVHDIVTEIMLQLGFSDEFSEASHNH